MMKILRMLGGLLPSVTVGIAASREEVTSTEIPGVPANESASAASILFLEGTEPGDVMQPGSDESSKKEENITNDELGQRSGQPSGEFNPRWLVNDDLAACTEVVEDVAEDVVSGPITGTILVHTTGVCHHAIPEKNDLA
ncbi:MAG TPA: hypothetical protein VGC95_00670, partial [Chitinophagaceae bacterium]